MGFFDKKASSVNEETINQCIALVYYTIDRLALVVNYHRIFYTGAAINLEMLINSSSFPGIEQFKFKLQMMDKMADQVKGFKQSKMLKFDHAANMKSMDDNLKKVSNNIKGLLKIYEDDLCVDFDENLFDPKHREILHRLFGECIGIANALNAEVDKLEAEYYLLRGAFDTIIPQQNWQSFNNMFKTLMDLRFNPKKH